MDTKSKNSRQFRGPVAWLAKTIPTGDWGEAEPFFHYLTGFVLVAPLMAMAVVFLISQFVSIDTARNFNFVVAASLVFCEVVVYLFVFTASSLAGIEEFAEHVAKTEQERKNISK